jgi:hypothetical protein
MLKKFNNIFYLISFLFFLLLVVKYYFSEENISFLDKSRSLYVTSFKNNVKSLPILKNDTNDIIFYTNDLEEFKSKRKKRFWEKLISK